MVSEPKVTLTASNRRPDPNMVLFREGAYLPEALPRETMASPPGELTDPHFSYWSCCKRLVTRRKVGWSRASRPPLAGDAARGSAHPGDERGPELSSPYATTGQRAYFRGGSPEPSGTRSFGGGDWTTPSRTTQ